MCYLRPSLGQILLWSMNQEIFWTKIKFNNIFFKSFVYYITMYRHIISCCMTTVPVNFQESPIIGNFK